MPRLARTAPTARVALAAAWIPRIETHRGIIVWTLSPEEERRIWGNRYCVKVDNKPLGRIAKVAWGGRRHRGLGEMPLKKGRNLRANAEACREGRRRSRWLQQEIPPPAFKMRMPSAHLAAAFGESGTDEHRQPIAPLGGVPSLPSVGNIRASLSHFSNPVQQARPALVSAIETRLAWSLRGLPFP